MKRRLSLLAFALGFTALFSGCTTVPESGRRQLMLVSAGEEAQMGLTAFEQIKQEEKVSTAPAVNARIQRIGQRIAGAVGRDLPNAQWEFVVFDSDTLNAFALPGGKVGFYQGLIDLASSDDEIAVVMGHEIAHVTSRHGGERVSQGMLAQLGGAAVQVGTQNSEHQQLFALAYGVGAQLGTLAYSRHHETEADEIGLRYAARAGYDPRSAVTFWQKMAAKNNGGEPPKFFSTHPPTGERIARLKALAAELMPVYEAAKRTR